MSVPIDVCPNRCLSQLFDCPKCPKSLQKCLIPRSIRNGVFRWPQREMNWSRNYVVGSMVKSHIMGHLNLIKLIFNLRLPPGSSLDWVPFPRIFRLLFFKWSPCSFCHTLMTNVFYLLPVVLRFHENSNSNNENYSNENCIEVSKMVYFFRWWTFR